MTHLRTAIRIASLSMTLAPPALIAQQSQFQGSVPSGTASSTPVLLTLQDAIDRGLKANLGLLVSDSVSEFARGARVRSLSALLPSVNGQISQTVEQLSLKTIGLNLSVPGVYVPVIVGPFHYTDAHASTSWDVFNYSSIKNYRSARESERAARLSAQDAHDLVVQAVATGYLQIIADASRIGAIRSQVRTAQTLYDRSVDQRRAGTAAGIDVLRSQVELKQQEQRLLAQENQFAKDKLALERIIGLPPGQDFNIGETVPFAPLTSFTPEQALRIAYNQRRDYQSYKAQVRAAEEAVKAARAERYPTGNIAFDYGDVGASLASSHGTFTFAASARFNIFDAGRISGDVIQAKAALKQRQDELADLGGQIDYQVRAAFLDIRTAADQVAVARSSLELANQTLDQARDRFAAGVTDNIEVVQAQESVASANDSLIGALFAHNLAKVELARTLGSGEQGLQRFVEEK
ncbi:MAG TPA: TolC family protein [Bryobacteraceae bacterium]|nr:TolC family protein [Bryobacteraceae bacterium]